MVWWWWWCVCVFSDQGAYFRISDGNILRQILGSEMDHGDMITILNNQRSLFSLVEMWCIFQLRRHHFDISVRIP